MQPNPTAIPGIDPQEQQLQQQFMTMPLSPPQSGSVPQAAPTIDPQEQLLEQQLMTMPSSPPQSVSVPQEPQHERQLLIVQPFPQQVNSADENRTLWIGGLQD